jgi:hypothetical protein
VEAQPVVVSVAIAMAGEINNSILFEEFILSQIILRFQYFF